MQNWPASLLKALFAALWLLCLPAWAQSYVDLYYEGLAAAERDDWPTVIDRMTRAAAADGNDQASKVLDGRIPRSYLPHHYLALAYAETNQCAKAREAASKPGLQQALASLAEQRQRQAQALAQCAAPPPPPPPPPPAFDADAALIALRQSIEPVQRRLQPARANPAALSDASRRELARIEGELRTLSASPLRNQAEVVQRQAQLSRLDNEARQLQSKVQAEQRVGLLAEAKTQLREQLSSAEQLIAAPELAELGATRSVLMEQIRQANVAIDQADISPATLQQRRDALLQAIAGARRDLAARERETQQRDAQLANLQGLLGDIGKFTADELRSADRALLQRAQSRLSAARSQFASADTTQLAALLREFNAFKNELDQAARAKTLYTRSWAEFRPLLLAYGSGDATRALAITVKPDWPAELRAHARLLRAAVLWTTRAAISEVNREIDAARDAASTPLRVPDQAFPPELLRRAQARGLQLQTSPGRPS